MARITRLAAALAALIVLSACPADEEAPRPVADAGEGGHVPKRALVGLHGSGTLRGEEVAGLTYDWRQTAGAAVTLSSPDSPTPSFVAPGVGGPITFELVVSAARNSEPSPVTLVVDNQPPFADAGTDLAVRSGWLASVNATASWDADGDPLSYTFVQTSGPAVILDTLAPGIARFTAPETLGELTFVVLVSDGEATAEDSASVRVYPPGSNLPPSASAGPDQNVASGAWVTLSGSGSDPDGRPVSMSWRQVGGPAVTLGGALTSWATFTAPAGDADLEFELTVSDGVDASTDRTVVHVGAPAPVISSVAITPAHPRTADDLVAAVTAYVPGSATPPSLAYAWSVNGALVAGQASATLPAALSKKGDVVGVKVTASADTRQATAEASVTIEDSPPVPRLSAPTELAFGETLSATVTLDDPDGDPVAPAALSLAYGPAGMALSAGGTLTWTPDLPMFDRSVEVHYGLAAGGAPLDGALRVVDGGREQPLRRAGFEIPTSGEAIRARDLDGDGRDELLVAGLSGLHVLEASGAGLAITWMAPFREPGFEVNTWGNPAAVEAVDVDGDGALELFHGVQNQLVRHDGATRRESGRASFDPTERLRVCQAADVDRDGEVELACLVGVDTYASGQAMGRLAVIDATTLAIEWTSASLPLGASLAAGDVDADAALELVTSGGFVFDGASHANEWTYGPGFGTFVRIGVLEKAGPAVILGGSPLRGYSATLKSPLWEYAGVGIPFLVRDVDGDGADEVVSFSTGWPAGLQALDFVGGAAVFTPAWTAAAGTFGYGPRALTVADLDGDGQAELVWDDGGSTTGEDSLLVGGPLSAQLSVRWLTSGPAQLDGPMRGGALARIGGGETRLVFQSVETDSGYSGSRLVLLDPATGGLTTSDELGSNWSGAGGLALADYDGDGVDEVFLGTASLYDGYFAAWDPATGQVAWSGTRGSSAAGAPTAVQAADLDADGFPDLVGLTSDGVVWVHDVRNQRLVWKSTTLGQATALEVAQLDGAGRPELVVGAGTRLVVFRWSDAAQSFLEVSTATVSSVADLAVGDCDGDGAAEVYALVGGYYGNDSREVVAFDAALVKRGGFTLPQAASSLYVEDLGTARKNLAVALAAPLTSSSYGRDPHVLAVLDPSSGAEVWRSPLLFGPVPRESATWLRMGGRWVISLGTGRSMTLTR